MNGSRGGFGAKPRGGGSFRGSRGGGGSFRGGYGGGNRSSYQQDANPGQIDLLPLGIFMHASEGDMVCRSTNEKIPYFNAPVYLQNKTQIGKVDEILGPINQAYFTIKVADGVVATSFKANDQVYISSDKLLPLERFLPKPKAPKTSRRSRKGGEGSGGSSRGGGYGGRGGRGGFSRGGGRGSSSRGSSSRGAGSRGSGGFSHRGRGRGY